MEKIKRIAEELIKLNEYKLIFVEERIKLIIDNEIKNNNEIEQLLDDLLDIMYTIYNENVVNLYKKLCKYYLQIHKQNATDYIYIYYKEHAPKENMNIIFLDIDGVLNSEEYFNTYKKKLDDFNKQNFKKSDNLYNIDDFDILLRWAMLRIDPKKIDLLRTIINQTNAKIVITSSWKELYYFSLVESRLRELGIPIIDVTDDNNYDRGKGIKEYIVNNNIQHYIIIDDDIFDDYDEALMSHLIKTSFKYGLSLEHVNLAIEKLSKIKLNIKKTYN